MLPLVVLHLPRPGLMPYWLPSNSVRLHLHLHMNGGRHLRLHSDRCTLLLLLILHALRTHGFLLVLRLQLIPLNLMSCTLLLASPTICSAAYLVWVTKKF